MQNSKNLSARSVENVKLTQADQRHLVKIIETIRTMSIIEVGVSAIRVEKFCESSAAEVRILLEGKGHHVSQNAQIWIGIDGKSIKIVTEGTAETQKTTDQTGIKNGNSTAKKHCQPVLS